MMRGAIMLRFINGETSASEAADTLGVSVRHIHRLRNRAASGGLQATLPQKRKSPPANKFSEDTVKRITEILETDLRGYGPKQAAEVLTNEYDLPVSRETVRKLMVAENLWRPHGKNGKGKTRVHRPRPRRSRFGQLILADTSFYEWIPGLDQMGLVVLIDDATSRLMGLSFTRTEGCMSYMQCFESYAQTHGLPESLYADRHKALLRLRSDWQGDGTRFESQFARALIELGVVPIPSYTPQGRGRVERAHRTLKDHLPKFLKRRKAFTLEAAAALLADYMEYHNAKLGVRPDAEGNSHRPCPDRSVLRQALSLHEHRKLSASMVVSFHNRKLVLKDIPSSNAAIGRHVTIHTHTDGTTSISFEGRHCPYVEALTKRPSRAETQQIRGWREQNVFKLPSDNFTCLDPWN